MGILRLASTEVKRIDLGDGDYIEVVQEISKKTFNRLVASMPEDLDEKKGMTPTQGTRFQTTLFELFVLGWSLPDAPTAENYELLSRDAASAIDEKLIEEFTAMTVGEPEQKKPRTSRAPSQKDTVPGTV